MGSGVTPDYRGLFWRFAVASAIVAGDHRDKEKDMLSSWLLLLALQSASALPAGYGEAQWGIGVSQLQALTPAIKADPSKGYTFAEHMEINPDVYVTPSATGPRVEYYFHAAKLYKVFVVYKRGQTDDGFYQKLIADLRKKHGEPRRSYLQTYFGFQVQHNLWEDADSILDLRMGAGFIYEVRVSKQLVQQKQQIKDLKDAI